MSFCFHCTEESGLSDFITMTSRKVLWHEKEEVFTSKEEVFSMQSDDFYDKTVFLGNNEEIKTS